MRFRLKANNSNEPKCMNFNLFYLINRSNLCFIDAKNSIIFFIYFYTHTRTYPTDSDNLSCRVLLSYAPTNRSDK